MVNPSLDDVTALLMQLEPTDLADLSRVQRALLSISKSSPVSITTLVLEAAQKMNALMNQTTSDAAGDLSEINNLIEKAQHAIENGEPDESSADALKQDAHAPSSANEDGETAQNADALPPDSDPDFLGEFITESRENIENAEAALLSLESDPEDLEAVNVVFRAFHTMKGVSMWLGLTRLAEFAHHAESLLSRVREREIRCTGGYADLSLRSVDMLKSLIQSVQNAIEGQPMTRPDGYDELLGILTNPEASGVTSETNEAMLATPRLGDIMVAEGKVTREQMEEVAAHQGDEPIGMAMLRTDAASLVDVAGALRTQARMAGTVAGTEPASESSVRVRTDRLDSLIDMVGELVIAHSMVAQDDIVLHGGHYELLRKIAHSGKIVRELQTLSMSMRMVPLKATFQKMTRLVRDLAQKGGKIITLETDGDDTEIDRNMVDVISDPLMHMVRNSCDHGVETPEVREQQGKPRGGIVRLSAYHSGGSVVIELEDDGKGLDRARITAKAVERGLIEQDKELSDSEVFSLIFEPGFSTAEKITDISGRGVGMDVVKRKIEAIRGRVDTTSVAGKGSTFTIRLPLTLAITDGILVRVGDERYIVPTVNIHLSFRPERSSLSMVAGSGEMVRLRDELMPMFRLQRLFNIDHAAMDPTEGLLVVVDDGKRRCALLVDELLGKQQVVAKSLGEGMKIQGITGGAILGDGRVGLILDPSEIVALARQPSTFAEAAGVM